MEDELFVRENNQFQNSISNNTVAIIAVILVIVGLLGIIFVTLDNGDNDSANTNVDTEVVDSEDDQASLPVNDTDDQDDEIDNEPQLESDDDDDTNQTPIEIDNDIEFAPPTDESKINIYYPNNSNSLGNGEVGPYQIDKPENPTESQLVSTIASQVVIGPNSDARSKGFYKPWSFDSNSTCGNNRTFTFAYSGSTLILELCREFQSDNPELFEKSLRISLSEATSLTAVKVNSPDGTCKVATNGC